MALYTEDEALQLAAAHKRLKGGKAQAVALVPVQNPPKGDPKLYLLMRPAKRFPSPARLKPLLQKAKRELKSQGTKLVLTKAVVGMATKTDRGTEIDVAIGDPSGVPGLQRELKKLAKQHRLPQLRRVTFRIDEQELDVPSPSDDDEEIDEHADEGVVIDESRIAEIEEREEALLRAGLGALTDALMEALGGDALVARFDMLESTLGPDFVRAIVALNEATDDAMDQLDALSDHLLELATHRHDTELADLAKRELSTVGRQEVFRSVSDLLATLAQGPSLTIEALTSRLHALDETLDDLIEEMQQDDRVRAVDAGLFPEVDVQVLATLQAAVTPLRMEIERTLESVE